MKENLIRISHNKKIVHGGESKYFLSREDYVLGLAGLPIAVLQHCYSIPAPSLEGRALRIPEGSHER